MLMAIEVVPFNGVSEYHPLTVVIDSSCAAPTVIDDLHRVLVRLPRPGARGAADGARRAARQAAHRRRAARASPSQGCTRSSRRCSARAVSGSAEAGRVEKDATWS